MKQWFVLLVAVALSASGLADDWSAWRGPNANGISSESGWNPKGAKKIWQKELGVGYSSVSVKGGKLYTMGSAEGEDTIYCLDAKTGQKIWEYSYPCEAGKYKGPRATPVVAGPNLYTVSREGDVFCFDAASGAVKWKSNVLKKTRNDNLRWGTSTSAVIENDLLLLNIGKSGVALDKNTGKVKWKSKGKHSYASPVVFDHKDKRCAAFFSAPGLYIVDAGTGKKIDHFEWKTDYDINGADPLIIGDQIFVSSGYEHGCAMFDFSSGKLEKVWKNETLRNQFSSSVYMDGHIYGVDGNHNKKGFLRCVDAVSGIEKWSTKIGFGSLIAADGTLIVLDDRGTLLFVKATSMDYEEVARFETGLSRLCWTPPVLANGILYCRNDKGTLVAIDVGE